MGGKYWDKAWSLIENCTRCSPGCQSCWLLSMNHRFHREGPVTPRWDRLDIPLKTRKPTVFAVWSDLFHEAVPTHFIDQAFRVMGKTQQHRFLILTKRPERAAEIMPEVLDGMQDLHNDDIWIGVTAENQEQADIRIPILRRIPGNRFVSVEPCIEQIDLCLSPGYETSVEYAHRGIHWVILGGETGHSARPCHTDWVRSVRDQCREAGVPFWFKQFGTYKGPGDWDIPPGRLLDGREWSEVPW